ncbi:MAG: hypothetical protein Q8Q06_03025 [bacterium]|nr:hypothetical protein [bacterium]
MKGQCEHGVVLGGWCRMCVVEDEAGRYQQGRGGDISRCPNPDCEDSRVGPSTLGGPGTDSYCYGCCSTF